MIRTAIRQIKIALFLLIILSILTGILYPLFITGIGQLFFPWQANGSLITKQGTTIGSKLIGQYFTDNKYFWVRPSATTPFPYNAANSSGSNLGPVNIKLFAAVSNRVGLLKKMSPQNMAIPIDLVTASASGLDPEISPYAAFFQAHRIAVSRAIPEDLVRKLIAEHIQKRTFRILGEPRINVLELNMALDNVDKDAT
jgi:potassium-transporting ATPase KdpC subunit